MYNEIRKKEFIATKVGTNLNSHFSKAEKMERELGKDLCDFNHEELLSLCDSIEGYGESAFRQFITTCHTYRAFCFEQGYSNQNDRISKQEIHDCLSNKMYKCYIEHEQFIDVLENIENPLDRFLVISQYEGLFKDFKIPNIYDLKVNDFIQKGNDYQIEIMGKLHTVSSTLYECAVESQAQNKLVGKRPDPLVGDGIIKYKKNKKNISEIDYTVTDLNKRIAAVRKRLKLPKETDFYLSGAIQYIYKRSREKDKSPIEYLKLYWEEFSLCYEFANRDDFIRKNKDYLGKMNPLNEFNDKKEKANNIKGKFIDYIKLGIQQKRIGDCGEKFVFEHEKQMVSQYNLPEEMCVLWMSKLEGDGLGYDILSYDESGREKYIEVKTTVGNIDENFFITKRELEVSIEKKDNYYLYRVYQMDLETCKGNIQVRQGDLSELCDNAWLFRTNIEDE